MLRRPTSLIAALLVVLLAAAACGSDDTDDTGAPATATTVPAPTPTTASTTAPAPAPGEPTLVSAGTSFGMCLGFCERTLTVDGTTATLVAVDREGPTRETTGTLSADAAAQLAEAVAAVDVTALEETYGCPDCTDGGAATLTFTPAGGGATATSTYDFGGPPPELADVDAVTRPIIDALSTCESTALVDVDPTCRPLF